MHTLLVTVGLPQSGKSTWAKQQGHPIVNPDAIRLALHGMAFIAQAERLVWTLAHYMAEALFLAGHETVIIDATNVTQARRNEWSNAKYPMPVEFVYREFHTPPAECIERARANGREYLVPVIERMSREWDLARPASWGESCPSP